MGIFDYFEIRKNRDPHYEGKFLIGSYSMGIFCNVTCPRTPPEHPDENDLVLLHNIYEGFDCGLVPCADCEPDMYSDHIVINQKVSPLIRRAITLLEQGYLDDHKVTELADELQISERYLRKTFSREIGISPSQLAVYHRGTIAKKLLSETSLPITDIAYASGFGSLRQFNQVMRNMYHAAPSSLRSQSITRDQEPNVMYIDTDPGFDFPGMLAELKQYEIPGIMRISADSYARSFLINGMKGYVEICEDRTDHRLVVTIHAKDKRCYFSVYYRILHMFDLLTKRSIVRNIIGEDSLCCYLKTHTVPYIYGWFDARECVIYSLLRQNYTHDRAMSILSGFVDRAGIPVQSDIPGINKAFPVSFRPDKLDREVLGLSETSMDLIRTTEEYLSQQRVFLSYYQGYREFLNDMMSIPGMHLNTVHYIALHGLGMRDVDHPDPVINGIASEWGDYRSYAARICELIMEDGGSITEVL